MDKSVREVGDLYADEICETINFELSDEHHLKITKNSGAVHHDTDMKNRLFGVDCKTSDVARLEDCPASIKAKDVKKTSEQADMSSRIGITVTRTREGDIASVMLDDMIYLIEAYMSKTKEKQ